MDSDYIKEKYARLRPDIQQGDLILFRGRKLLSKIIQESDSDAYYNHVGVVGKICGAVFIIDSNANGVHPERLSSRIEGYSGFTIIRSYKNYRAINKSLTKLLKRQEETDIKYDFINGAKALFNRWFGLNLKTKKVYNRDICSMFVYRMRLNWKWCFL